MSGDLAAVESAIDRLSSSISCDPGDPNLYPILLELQSLNTHTSRIAAVLENMEHIVKNPTGDSSLEKLAVAVQDLADAFAK